METPALLNCLKSYANLFQNIAPIPISWNTSKRKCVYCLNHRKLIFFYIELCIGFLVTFSCGYASLKALFLKGANIPLYSSIYNAFYALMAGVLGCGGSLCALFYGHPLAQGWDNCVILERTSRSYVGKKFVAKRRPYYDLWFFLLEMEIFYYTPILCLIGSFVEVVTKLDLFYYILQDMVPKMYM